MDKDTAPVKPTLRAAAIAAVVMMGSWCGPALGSIGIDDAAERSLGDTAVAKSELESVHESASAEEAALSNSETPMINARLPGVSDSVLPSFRHQMYRTDI